MIKTITATSDNKDDNYTLLCMLHHLVLQGLPTSKVWELELTYTNVTEGIAVTTVTNGIVNIEASSDNGHHRYTLSPTNKED